MRNIFCFVLAFIVLMGFVCAASYEGSTAVVFSSGDVENETIIYEPVADSVNVSDYLIAGLVIIVLVLAVYYLRRKYSARHKKK